MSLNKKPLAELREFYENEPVKAEALARGPMNLFADWLDTAIEHDLDEPNAMILATATKNGFPSARTVLLKDLTKEGFVFYSNYESRKGRELDNNPYASLVFLWLPLARQVRIEGTVEKVERSVAQSYFNSRPVGSQIGAWTSPQSRPIPDRTWLDRRQEEMKKKFKTAGEIPLPPFWGGYIVRPVQIEFWQGRPNRLHDRFLFSRNKEEWHMERLAP